MSNFRFTVWGRYGVAAIVGVCLALAFPRSNIAGLAWAAPALMLAAAWGTRGGETFRIGYVAGLARYLTSLYWLLHIPLRGYPVLGLIALSAYLALFPATWVWLTIAGRGSDTCPVASSDNWHRRTLWAFIGAATWVALEMLLARLLGGFPWNFLGVSQYQLLPLVQVASVTGVYGVSFLVVWISLALVNAVLAVCRQPTNRYVWLGEIILPATALVAIFALGLRQLHQASEGSRELRVTFVQPSIPQTLIWDRNENSNRFRQLLELSTRALMGETDLLLWPEAAVPNMLRHDEATRRAVTGLARSNRLWMIAGSDDAELRAGGKSEDDVNYFNSSFLISPAGEIVASYRKNHLVMFGEFIPLARWLPFVKWLTPISGGFTPGAKPIPFVLEPRSPTRLAVDAVSPSAETEDGAPDRMKTTTVICFEDVFPHLVRRYVEADTDFLVNLTNDGWFGESAAQWQHAANAVFRAVENGLPLLRCCNNGLTCWVDASGRIREIFRDPAGSVYGTGFMTVRLSLPGPDERPSRTFYTKHGDWFGWGCTGIALLAFAARIRAGLRACRASS